jgi:diguanylate cyclase (GGDEF)-like protein
MDRGAGTQAGTRMLWIVVLPALLAVLAMLAARAGMPAAGCFDVAWTSSAVSALAAMLLGRRRAPGASRGRWTLWAVATASWLGGQLAWDVFGIVGSPPSPNLADVGWWGFAILVVAGMVRTPGASRAVRLVAAAEAVPLIAAAMALTFAELWSDAAASSLPMAGRVAALAYPALYVSAAVLTLQAIIGGSLRSVRSPATQLVLCGTVAQAVAFILWSEQLLEQSYVPGATVLDPLWVLGLLAIAGGGALATLRPDVSATAEEPSQRGGVLPAAMFVVLLAALVNARFGHSPAGAGITLALGVLFSGGALVARGALLQRRLRVLLDRERAARAELAEREGELAQLNERLVEDSRRDPLTGMRNRRALSEDLPRLDALRDEPGGSFALALCDVDCFKAYNDCLGHLAGDQALRALAARVRGALRAGDAAYRFGGEELLLVLSGTGAKEAMAAAERVRAAVADAALPHPEGIDGILTVSIGVAAGGGDCGTLLAQADAALYEAKRAGRNRVVAARDGAAPLVPPRARAGLEEGPVPRHLRSMLAISRAAAAGRGVAPVLEALAETIRSELSFQVVAVNLLDETRGELRVAVVLGDQEARDTLLGTVNPWSDWEPLMDSEHQRCGAIWLPAGAHEWASSTTIWTPQSSASPDADSWDPEDMLLLPLRGSGGEVLGIVSVDQPLSGRRPDDAELTVLMAVADHAALALEQVERDTRQFAAMREQSRELRLAAVMLLAEALDVRDAGTAAHSQIVGAFARDTAAALGLPPERVEQVHAAGVVHDLGKLGIADAIIYKPAALDEQEWREMRRHPEIGARILEHAGLDEIAAWVRSHHERVDGAGYPAGLSADEIPLEARILAVADAYEAMIADRPYRAGSSTEEACAELVRCAGSQFDPAVVDAFLTVLGREPGDGSLASAA